jgi:hypothetical protein
LRRNQKACCQSRGRKNPNALTEFGADPQNIQLPPQIVGYGEIDDPHPALDDAVAVEASLELGYAGAHLLGEDKRTLAVTRGQRRSTGHVDSTWKL